MQLGVPFILASGSPRRKHLLQQTGFEFTVLPADLDEKTLPGESVNEMVSRLAAEKASCVSDLHPDALVLGSDTTVEVDGTVLGKPTSKQEAIEMLCRLSGRVHKVHTGIALAHGVSKRLVTTVETTSVEFDEINSTEITRYVETGSPMDKAGSYGIQDEGAFFVKGIRGDFYTVMGLPLHRLYRLLRSDFDDLIA